MTRVVYAGIPIGMPYSVLIVDLEVRRPVFHKLGSKLDVPGCGAEGFSVLSIPFKHARRFARPCLRCWPALRGQAELELKEGVL